MACIGWMMMVYRGIDTATVAPLLSSHDFCQIVFCCRWFCFSTEMMDERQADKCARRRRRDHTIGITWLSDDTDDGLCDTTKTYYNVTWWWIEVSAAHGIQWQQHQRTLKQQMHENSNNYNGWMVMDGRYYSNIDVCMSDEVWKLIQTYCYKLKLTFSWQEWCEEHWQNLDCIHCRRHMGFNNNCWSTIGDCAPWPNTHQITTIVSTFVTQHTTWKNDVLYDEQRVMTIRNKLAINI